METIIAIVIMGVFAYAFWRILLTERPVERTSYAQERWRRKRRLRALEMDDVDRMDGIPFQHYVGELLEHQGYDVDVRRGSGDFGADIIAGKNGLRYAIQVKRRSSNVSRTAVSDAVAGMHHFDCDVPMAVTNSLFTKGAKEHAASTGCILIDRHALAEWILDFRGPDLEAQLRLAVGHWVSRDRAAARKTLQKILDLDPYYESAWLWMAQCAETSVDRIRALEKVLQINPRNTNARRFLRRTRTARFKERFSLHWKLVAFGMAAIGIASVLAAGWLISSYRDSTDPSLANNKALLATNEALYTELMMTNTPLPTHTPLPTNTPSPVGFGTAKERILLHARPHFRSSVSGKVDKGTILPVFGRQGRWVLVQPDQRGWAIRDELDLSIDFASIPEVK